MEEKIMIARLITGDLVIGNLRGNFLENPYMLGVVPVDSKTLKFEISPYFLSLYDESAEKPYIFADKIVALAKPKTDVLNLYREAISKIVVPKVSHLKVVK